MITFRMHDVHALNPKKPKWIEDNFNVTEYRLVGHGGTFMNTFFESAISISYSELKMNLAELCLFLTSTDARYQSEKAMHPVWL